MSQSELQVPLSRKVVAWVIAIAMALLLMPAFAGFMPQTAWADEGDWTGSGTASDPYVISDAAGLAKLATNVNANNNYADTYFELGADIDLNSYSNWTPIGYSTDNSMGRTFAGSFDGGLILRRGNVEVNCTVELLVELSRNELSARVAELLFA